MESFEYKLKGKNDNSRVDSSFEVEGELGTRILRIGFSNFRVFIISIIYNDL